MLVVLNGLLIEIDYAYKQAMSLPNQLMPTAPLLQLPQAFRNSPVAEMSVVKEFDRMTIVSGTVMWMD